MDTIHYSVRQDGMNSKKSVYILIGINTRGEKEILGFWLNILNEIGSRGVQDNLIISVDNLKEFSGAIKSKYPKSEIQKCIVYQIRNSIKYVASKDMKEFTKDLKQG